MILATALPILESQLLGCIFVFILGAILGSFYNVLIYRMPDKTLFNHHRSRCYWCGTLIPIWHNIPCLSWLILRGQAACCNQPLPRQYLLVEWLTASGFVLIYLATPFLTPTAPELIHTDNMIRFAHNSLFFSILLISSVIDIRLRIIPNELTYGLVLTAPLWMLIHPELNVLSSVLGIGLGGGILYGVAVVYFLIRKQMGMGMGDVKFLAGIGGWLGYQAIIPTLFSACLLGSLIGGGIMLKTNQAMSKQQIPFGPFLAAGALLYHYTGHHILEIILWPLRGT